MLSGMTMIAELEARSTSNDSISPKAGGKYVRLLQSWTFRFFRCLHLLMLFGIDLMAVFDTTRSSKDSNWSMFSGKLSRLVQPWS
ncbi:hypothetical protein L1987_31114 [Smallanthus sonchifolius]|uniref:Uncharacterized protein n=1 Tax=Smallanthus sonchifolius TaxID=185202 RepID=A0ACB9I5B6_9ASTR|nr:hypothetical protein L1987_31114 [Smallanthus sonchifolius]